MKTIKMLVLDWWEQDSQENFYNNFFIKILQKHFDVRYSKEPDFVLYGPFGKKHLEYECVRIFYTGENVRPDFNICDYAISYDYINFLDRAFRFPLFVTYDALDLAESKHILSDIDIDKKQKFCSFIVSNAMKAMPLREEMFDRLSKYKKVDSGGGYRNNIGGRVGDKILFNNDYKFNICFENTVSPGYMTEKIVEAYASKCVPIYYGDIATKDGYLEKYQMQPDINNKSCVNLHNFDSVEECIEHIIKIDNDMDLYIKMLKEKAFLKENIKKYYMLGLEKFLLNIFAQDVNLAMRRGASMWIRRHVYAMSPRHIKTKMVLARVKSDIKHKFKKHKD